MAISLPVPNDITHKALNQLLRDILRRAVDGSNGGSLQFPNQVTGMDLGTITGGSGLVLPTRSGLYFGRLLLENPDVNNNLDLSVDPGAVSTANDIVVSGGGNGLVLYSRNGAVRGRVILEEPDANGNIIVSCDPNVTIVNNNDAYIKTAGFGFLLPSRDGTKRGRLILENADSNGNLVISVDPI